MIPSTRASYNAWIQKKDFAASVASITKQLTLVARFPHNGSFRNLYQGENESPHAYGSSSSRTNVAITSQAATRQILQSVSY